MRKNRARRNTEQSTLKFKFITKALVKQGLTGSLFLEFISKACFQGFTANSNIGDLRLELDMTSRKEPELDEYSDYEIYLARCINLMDKEIFITFVFSQLINLGHLLESYKSEHVSLVVTKYERDVLTEKTDITLQLKSKLFKLKNTPFREIENGYIVEVDYESFIDHLDMDVNEILVFHKGKYTSTAMIGIKPIPKTSKATVELIASSKQAKIMEGVHNGPR